MRSIALHVVLIAGFFSATQLCAANSKEASQADLKPESIEAAVQITQSMLTSAKREIDDLSAENCSSLGDTYGLVVAQADSLSPAAKHLRSLREHGEGLAKLCRKVVRSFERQHRDDEHALEAFYRSRDWYLMNGAFSTLRYWQAWIDLALARIALAPEQQLRMLSKAERGFQLTSLRIHYPRIVYGSWLGLVKVEVERENYEKAEKRLQLLGEALAGGSLAELQAAVDRERRVLKLLQGDDLPLKPQSEQLSPATAEALLSEAFILLERRREEDTGGAAAAKRLKKVLQSGFLDDQLLARLMAFREQIVGTDIGPIGRLIEMEYAFDYQKYNTVVLKYREYLSSALAPSNLNLSIYQYHYAVSLYHIELYEDAMSAIENLRNTNDHATRLEPSLSKLQFATAGKLFQHRSDTKSKQAYVESASLLVNTVQTDGSSDSELASAWAVLARFENDESTSREYYSKALLISGDNGELVILSKFLKLGELLEQAYLVYDTSRMKTLAKEAMSVYRDLAKTQRKDPAVAALTMQFTATVGESPENISREISQLLIEHADNESIQRRLFRAQLLLAGHPPSSLSSYVKDLMSSKTSHWIHDELYTLIAAKERSGDVSELAYVAGLLMPKYSGSPEAYRYLQLVKIRSYLHMKKFDIAFRSATNMVTEFPESGDAWKIYAEVAEQSDNIFEADRAWARISSASAEGSPIWLDSAIKRLELQGYESRDVACNILNDSARYSRAMDARQYASLGKWNQQLNCQIQEYEGT